MEHQGTTEGEGRTKEVTGQNPDYNFEKVRCFKTMTREVIRLTPFPPPTLPSSPPLLSLFPYAYMFSFVTDGGLCL